MSVDDKNKVTTNYYDVLRIDERKLEVLQNNHEELIKYVNIRAGIGSGFMKVKIYYGGTCASADGNTAQQTHQEGAGSLWQSGV